MRPDNGPAMNTTAMWDFDNPRDSKYGEADVIQVNIICGARILLKTHRTTFPQTTAPGDL